VLLMLAPPADSQSWTTKKSMPTARYQLAVVSVDSVIYTLGGNPYRTTNEVYTPATDSWATRTAMPAGRSLMSAAAITGRLYVAGGGWPGAFFNMQMYDLASDSWTSRKSMPDNAYMPTYKYGWDVWGDRLHVVGGYDGRPGACVFPANCRTTVHTAYTGANDAWTSLKPMPTQREDHGAAVVGGSLFAVGGTNPSQTILAVTEKYAHSTDSWTTVKSVPSSRYCLADSAVRAIGTMLVVIGGFDKGKAFEMYTPSTDTWATKTSMPTSRIWHGIVAIGARIYAIGGTDPAESTLYKSVEVWVDTTSYAQVTISRASPVNAASTFTGAMSISGINFASLDQTPSSFASRAIMR
jgi:hypothetical protein